MTKLKTKKGKPIAKRTLSVILAAAMVLSSNSLVWANVETEPQAEVEAAVEAPAEEVTTDEVEVAAEVNATSDLKLTLNGENTTEIPWSEDGNGAVRISGTVTLNDGTEVVFENGVVSNAIITKCVWKINDQEFSQEEDCPAIPKEEIGKSLSLMIYGTTNKIDWIAESAPVTIGKQHLSVDLTGAKVTDNGKNIRNGGTREYTGKAPVISVTNGPEITGIEYSVSGLKDGQEDMINAGSTITVSAALSGDSAKYYNLDVTPVVYSIVAKKLTDNELKNAALKAEFKAGKEYTYTGKEIEIPVEDVNVYEMIGTTKGDDLSAAVESIILSGYTAGKNTGSVTLKFNDEKLANYDFSGISSNISVGGDYKINKLDLKNVKVELPTIRYNETLATVQQHIDWAVREGLAKFYDAATGEELDLASKVNIQCSGNAAVGTFTAAVTPVDTTNLSGSAAVKVVLTTNTFANVYFKGENPLAAEEYTGEEITKSSEDLGDLLLPVENGDPKVISKNQYTISYENNVNAGTAYLVIKGTDNGDYKDCVQKIPFTINKAKLDDKVSTAAEKVVFDKDIEEAKEYAEQMNVVVKATNKDGKEFTVDANDYTVEYTFEKVGKIDGNVLGNNVVATIKAKANSNFYGTIKEKSQIALATPVVSLDKETYVYTGKNIEPEVTVTLGTKELRRGTDYTVKYVGGKNVGEATVVVTGTSEYPTLSAEKKFTITPAKAEDVKVTVKDVEYTGEKYSNADDLVVSVTLNGVNVTDEFDLSVPEGKNVNVNAGEDAGIVVATPNEANAKNYEGVKEHTFDIAPAELTGNLTLYDENGAKIDSFDSVEYDGTAKTFADKQIKFTATNALKAKVTENDYEITYANNIDAGTATIFVVGKNNFAGKAADITDKKTETVYKSVVDGAMTTFKITGSTFTASNVTVGKTAEYGQGVPVTPDVKVVKNGKTLTEGVDYELDVTVGGIEVGKNNKVVVKGINGYATSKPIPAYTYEIVAKDLANCELIATGDNVTVMNGDVVVPSSEYTVKDNGDGTVTVTAKESSKNYKGSATAEIVESSNQVLDVVAKPYTKTKIHVTWRNIKGADSYVIYKDGVKIAEAEDGKEGYIDGGMHSYDGIYEYQVAAVFNGKEGEKSDIYESTTRPADPVVNNAFTHKNGIRVETKAKGAEGYRVWIRQGGSNPTEYVEKKSTYGNYTFKDLKNGQKYVIKVQAYKLVNGKKVPSRNVVYVTGKAETAKKSLI